MRTFDARRAGAIRNYLTAYYNRSLGLTVLLWVPPHVRSERHSFGQTWRGILVLGKRTLCPVPRRGGGRWMLWALAPARPAPALFSRFGRGARYRARCPSSLGSFAPTIDQVTIIKSWCIFSFSYRRMCGKTSAFRLAPCTTRCTVPVLSAAEVIAGIRAGRDGAHT